MVMLWRKYRRKFTYIYNLLSHIVNAGSEYVAMVRQSYFENIQRYDTKRGDSKVVEVQNSHHVANARRKRAFAIGERLANFPWQFC